MPTTSIGVAELQKQLLQAASELGYQVLLGSKWLGGAECHWDKQKRQYENQVLMQQDLWGLCFFRYRTIWISDVIDQQHRVAILTHEVAHALMHCGIKRISYKVREAEAEEVCWQLGPRIGMHLKTGRVEEWQALNRWQKYAVKRRAHWAIEDLSKITAL